jgi:hypothetical protein
VHLAAGQLVFDIPSGYSLAAFYGADLLPINGAWNWQLLVHGAHYTVSNGAVTILGQNRKVIRIGLIRN